MSESTTLKADSAPDRVPGDVDGGGGGGTQTEPGPRPKPSGVGRRPSCSGCARPIGDRFMLYAVDRHWHVGCLRCSLCQMPLDDSIATCYTRAGLILCRSDYLRSVLHYVGDCKRLPGRLETLVSQMHRRIYVLKCEGPIFSRERVESGESFFVLDLGGVTQPLVYF